MVKNILIVIEDKDYEKLSKFKEEQKLTWRELLLSLLE